MWYVRGSLPKNNSLSYVGDKPNKEKKIISKMLSSHNNWIIKR